jgi:hypothetical protein
MMDNPARATIPDDVVINAEIVITSYFDSDGKLMYACRVNGEINMAQAIGLTELAKDAIKEYYLSDDNKEDDDGNG